jgi:hypothetical protein
MTKVELVLVLLVEDLDRCVDGGRIFKVLEAIRFILSIPNVAIICFLAFDSRIIITSIENDLKNSTNSESAQKSGRKYLEKLVRLRICLPDMKHTETLIRLKADNKMNYFPTEVQEAFKIISRHVTISYRTLIRILNTTKMIFQNIEVKESFVDFHSYVNFLVKLVKWIFLCECYPHKMNFLTEAILGFDQKLCFIQNNNTITTAVFKQKQILYKNVPFSHGFYVNNSLQLPIETFYHKYVEEYNFINNTADAKQSFFWLDGDQETFLNVLHLKHILRFDNKFVIKVEDILGPITNQLTRQRDLKKSLLFYSLNLNPALRDLIPNTLVHF